MKIIRVNINDKDKKDIEDYFKYKIEFDPKVISKIPVDKKLMVRELDGFYIEIEIDPTKFHKRIYIGVILKDNKGKIIKKISENITNIEEFKVGIYVSFWNVNSCGSTSFFGYKDFHVKLAFEPNKEDLKKCEIDRADFIENINSNWYSTMLLYDKSFNDDIERIDLIYALLMNKLELREEEDTNYLIGKLGYFGYDEVVDKPLKPKTKDEIFDYLMHYITGKLYLTKKPIIHKSTIKLRYVEYLRLCTE